MKDTLTLTNTTSQGTTITRSWSWNWHLCQCCGKRPAVLTWVTPGGGVRWLCGICANDLDLPEERA